MKSINKLPEGKILLNLLNNKQFSRPLKCLSHRTDTHKTKQKKLLYKIMFYVIEADLINSYW